MAEPTIITEVRKLHIPDLQRELVARLELDLSKILGRARELTLRHVLSFKNDVITISGYSFPLRPLLLRRVREFYDQAYSLSSHRKKSTRVRGKADLNASIIVSKIEADLKTGWARFGGSRLMIVSHTNKVFDDWGAN
jgi:hypothetical protein